MEKDQLKARTSSKKLAVAALMEIGGVYAGGQLVTWLLCLLLGVAPVNPLQRLVPNMGNSELVSLSISLAAAVEPAKLGGYLGILLKQDWRLPGFWLLTSIGSFGLVPFLEELFYRGYCQHRLSESLGAPAGIAATALLFTFSHSQYLQPELINLITLSGILFSSLLYGAVVWRYESLVPVLVAHILVNIPLRTGFIEWLVLGGMLLCIVLARHRIVRAWRVFMRLCKADYSVSLLLVACAASLVLALALWKLQNVLILLGLPLLGLALVLDRPKRHKTQGYV